VGGLCCANTLLIHQAQPVYEAGWGFPACVKLLGPHLVSAQPATHAVVILHHISQQGPPPAWYSSSPHTFTHAPLPLPPLKPQARQA
jgi:hypothetical protein